jgi:hypothetical protein
METTPELNLYVLRCFMWLIWGAISLLCRPDFTFGARLARVWIRYDDQICSWDETVRPRKTKNAREIWNNIIEERRWCAR